MLVWCTWTHHLLKHFWLHFFNLQAVPSTRVTFCNWSASFNTPSCYLVNSSLCHAGVDHCPFLQTECDVPQIHLLSLEMEPRLHHGCPPNCCDRFSWLPHNVSLQILSFLDPGVSSKYTDNHVTTYIDHLKKSTARPTVHT